MLVASILHLRSGATPDITDGLAAAYIGVSVAFGPSIIRRMDARFAHRFARAPAPPLLGWIARVTLVLLIWAIWPVTYTLWPTKPKADRR